ncbi:hypothetical protein DY000_02007386 [Brassica cretica]|uniref:Uncharacterized protein n=1 Tax=Brassica cretica TaxID=69181 RepID=A0ABQ7C5H7_BRACR|nr:hypothetical protein DY000_02007386 [Brassica cretica]
MSYGSWFLDETPLPKLGFLGQGNNGYVTLSHETRVSCSFSRKIRPILLFSRRNLHSRCIFVGFYESIDFEPLSAANLVSAVLRHLYRRLIIHRCTDYDSVSPLSFDSIASC